MPKSCEHEERSDELEELETAETDVDTLQISMSICLNSHLSVG